MAAEAGSTRTEWLRSLSAMAWTISAGVSMAFPLNGSLTTGPPFSPNAVNITSLVLALLEEDDDDDEDEEEDEEEDEDAVAAA